MANDDVERRRRPTWMWWRRGKAEFSDNFDHEAAKELAKLVKKVIDDPEMRPRFRENPVEVAREEGVRITPKSERIIRRLGGYSDDDLALLADLNDFLRKEDLYVETDNPPLMVF